MKNDKSMALDRVELIQLVTRVMKRVSQPMIATSADKRLLYWNAAFSKLIGYNDKELSDPIISAGLTAPEWHESETKALEKLQRTRKSQTFQKEYIRKDSTRIPVEVLLYQLRGGSGRVPYYVGLITDITERKQLQETLQKSENHYRILVENAIEGIVVIQDGEIKFVNPIVAIGTGYTVDEILSMPLKELLCSDNEKSAVESIIKEAVPGSLLVVPLLKIRTKDGRTRLIESTVLSIIWDDKPANLNLLRDITDRYQAEQVVRESEKKYRSILEDISEGYWEVDLAGNFTSFNNAVCQLLGYPEEEMAGMNYRAYTSPDDVDKVYRAFNQVYITGNPIKNMHYEIVQKGGSKKFAETSVFLRQNKNGETIGFRGVSHDVTERIQMEEVLRRSEERYRTILDEMQNAYFELDLAGNYTFGNDSLYRYLGYSPSELIGTNTRAVTAADDVEMLYQKFNQLYRTGTPINNLVYKTIRKDGSIGYVEISASLLRNEKGEIIGFRGVGRDITQRLQIEESLKQSEEKYRSTLEQMEEAYYEVDLAGNFTFFNDAMWRQLGYSKEELMGMNYKVYTPAEDANKVFQAFNQVYRTGEPLKAFQEKNIRKDGTILIFENSVSPIRNNKGEITGFRGVGRDVTQRLQMEEALKRSEERYRTIMEEMHDDYFENDLAGSYTFVNDAFCRSTGYDREELIGKNYSITTHKDYIKGIFKAFNNIYRTGQPIKNFPHIFVRKDGSYGAGELSAFPLRNENGEIIGFRGVSHDVTERKQMEEALRQSEEKYRTILEDMEESYYEDDLAGNLTFVNDAVCRDLGYSREELIGMNYKVYTPPEDVEKVFQAYNEVYRTGKPILQFSNKEIRKDGTRIIVEISILPVRNEKGEITGFRGVGRDITERVQMEEALRQSEEKYRSVLERMEEAYSEVDLAGNFTFFNNALCQHLGYSREELLGMNYKVYTSPETVNKVYQTYNQVYRTGEPSRLFAIEEIKKDGNQMVAEISVSPLRNETGEITGFRQVSRNITERIRMETDLRRSEERYRTIMDEMHDDYFEQDLSGNYTFVNDAMCQQLGYTREELTGMNYRTIVDSNDVESLYQVFNNTYYTGQPNRAINFKFIRKDGSTGVGEVSAFPLRNEKGEIIGFRGVSHDVTERKQMEEALRRSEERYRTILDDIKEGYFEMDLAGNFTFFNDALCRLIGYSREELMGMNYRVYVPPEKRKEAFEIYNRIYRTGEPASMIDVVQIRKDGKRIFVESSAYPIKNEKGEIIGFRGVSHDVTERKQMEEALRRSEERYRTVLEDVEEAYYEEDLAGNFTLFNDALCRQLGYSREELMGMNYKSYTPPEDVDRVFKAFNHIYRTGEPLRLFPMERIKKDGTRIYTETSGSRLLDEKGEIIGFRGVIHDTTVQKKAEEEKRQLEQKAQLASRLASVGELASGVAHEINNPLTGVIGYAHLLLARKDISRDVRRDLEIINEGAQRVAGIVKKLLAFARQTKPEQRYVNINELIGNTLDLRAYELAASNIKVTLQLSRDMPMTIADPGQLQQVFLNLIINAETEMKLAHDRGKLTIKTERINNTLRITFKDNGPGIARENLQTIFDPFFTTREVGQGTGLGLSVCHGIVTEHNGRIWVESELGKGAAFIIELPLATEEGRFETPEPVIEEVTSVAKARILVVDDEPVIRQFISQVLGEQGHTVETVDNAASALKMVKSKRYRLILLDIKMPGMGGVELYKKFQKIAPSLTKRIVFITGDVMGKRTMSFLDKTKTHYIMKPFDARQLKAEINRILARK
jgi:PAS domain S-box-containing protein